ncbi:protein phosphatase methylesterase 1 isoform X2 [Syngnathoides biaculeatus]|uniref:protein phosphatase methylesterase 1 isoform X2 n=1 Tax=Syngnathoides biaculeatus TaxID=300417 RepID=UPI002ADD6E82|nr:protein phosphatase methylesterase 1 isoform X2 [Syngnathoides biaculeatus]
MEKQLHLNLLASRPPMPAGLQSGSKMKMGPGRRRDFTPLSWSQYFETMEDVEVGNENGKDIFRVYCSGSHGPVLLLLHGGGHSALSWAVFTAVIYSRINCRVVAVDLRAHGDSKVKNSEDLSADTMAKDIGKVVEALYGDDPPPIMIIGHSMGGAIAVHTAAANHIPSLLGLCVIDVVEGTAMDALNSMQNFLRSRPKLFKSLENAIEWSVKSGQIRNIESARVSMGGQVHKCEESSKTPVVATSIGEGIIEEEEEEEDEAGEEESNKKRMKEDDQEPKKDGIFTWRVDLAKTEKYWEGWFKGLSALFLTCSVPKLLLLAGVDRLDKDLTIGQMQGKFQMQVLPQCGHAVHEDAPEKVADALATFMVRHKFTDFKEGFLW